MSSLTSLAAQPVATSLRESGIDSLVAIRLTNALVPTFPQETPPQRMFKHRQAEHNNMALSSVRLTHQCVADYTIASGTNTFFV